MNRLATLVLLGVLAGALHADVSPKESPVDDRWFIGVCGSLLIPQGGSHLPAAGGAAVRGGAYLNEDWAIEGTAEQVEDVTGLGVDALWHWQGCDLYGDLFGYSRFDPFFTVGARGWIGHDCGQVGPKAGIGAFYHLTDAWSVRADAEATLGVESDREMLYSLSVGLQYSF